MISRPMELKHTEMLDWTGRAVPVAHSKGGVKAFAHPFDNLVRSGFTASGGRRKSSGEAPYQHIAESDQRFLRKIRPPVKSGASLSRFSP